MSSGVRRAALIIISLCLVAVIGCAAAEQSVKLPKSKYVIEIPDWMRYSNADEEEAYKGVEAYVSEMLEIDYTAYPKTTLIGPGAAGSLREVAEVSAAKGNEVELRKINGVEMLCFRTMDESDKAPCIGYVFVDGEWIVEVDFWYSTQEAADLTTQIIASIHQ